jgi:hypothetical protein
MGFIFDKEKTNELIISFTIKNSNTKETKTVEFRVSDFKLLPNKYSLHKIIAGNYLLY